LDKNQDITAPVCDLTEGPSTIRLGINLNGRRFAGAVSSARFLYSEGTLDALQFVAVVLREAQLFIDDDVAICLDSRYAPSSYYDDNTQPAPLLNLGYQHWSGNLYIPQPQ